jgi:hypothetical protein
MIKRTKVAAVCGVALAALLPTVMTANAAAVGALAFANAGATITTGSCGPDVCWYSGSGTYTFATGGGSVCVAASAQPTAGAGLCAITSSGSFVNVVCGTGSADSFGTTTVTITTTLAGTVTVPTGINYEIFFAGGVGVLIGDGNSAGTINGGNVDLAGAVDISAVPSPPNPLAADLGPCTPTFNVSAAIAVAG